LTGESKQYVGNLYIGGTHPAANGGAWQAAIHGFAGLSIKDGVIALNPALPVQWSLLRFSFYALGQRYTASIDREGLLIESDKGSSSAQRFVINGEPAVCLPGDTLDSRLLHINEP